jgi:hypothetical protein
LKFQRHSPAKVCQQSSRKLATSLATIEFR